MIDTEGTFEAEIEGGDSEVLEERRVVRAAA